MTITVIERKSYTGKVVSAGNDIVVASMPIPPGGVLLGTRVECHFVSSVHFPLATSAATIFGKSVVVGRGGQMDVGLSVQ